MKKIRIFSYLAMAAAAVFAPLMGSAPVSAAGPTVTYKDYSELSSSLNHAYSYTKVYWTDDTKITVVRAAGNRKKGFSFDVNRANRVGVGNILENETLTLFIENSTATD